MLVNASDLRSSIPCYRTLRETVRIVFMRDTDLFCKPIDGPGRRGKGVQRTGGGEKALF